jgi:hypothetical protein
LQILQKIRNFVQFISPMKNLKSYIFWLVVIAVNVLWVCIVSGMLAWLLPAVSSSVALFMMFAGDNISSK